MSTNPGIGDVVATMWEALVDEQSFEGALDRFVGVARDAMPGAADAGLTMSDGDRPRTPAFTSNRVANVDQVQYDAGSGPCLQAWQSGLVVELASTATDGRWDRFCAACRSSDIGSVLSVPLLAGDERLGALNFYGATPNAFDGAARSIAGEMGLQVAVLLDSAVTYWIARARAERMDPSALHGSIDVGAAARGPWRVALHGEFDEPEAGELRALLMGLVDRSDRAIELEMSRVRYMGSSGLAAVLDAWEAATLHGLRLEVTRPSPMVRRLLDLVGLNDLVRTTA